MLILGEAHLRAVLAEYQEHHNSARPHQGIAQRVPDAGRDAPQAAMTDLDIERIRRKPVLNGLIHPRRLKPARTAGHLPNRVFERDKIANSIVPRAAKRPGQQQ
jgi:hypothetical protein